MYIYIYIKATLLASAPSSLVDMTSVQKTFSACGRVIYVYGRAAARSATYITCFAAWETFGDQAGHNAQPARGLMVAAAKNEYRPSTVLRGRNNPATHALHHEPVIFLFCGLAGSFVALCRWTWAITRQREGGETTMKYTKVAPTTWSKSRFCAKSLRLSQVGAPHPVSRLTCRAGWRVAWIRRKRRNNNNNNNNNNNDNNDDHDNNNINNKHTGLFLLRHQLRHEADGRGARPSLTESTGRPGRSSHQKPPKLRNTLYTLPSEPQPDHKHI